MDPIGAIHESHWNLQLAAALEECLSELQGANCHLAQHQLTLFTTHLIWILKSECSNELGIQKK